MTEVNRKRKSSAAMLKLSMSASVAQQRAQHLRKAFQKHNTRSPPSATHEHPQVHKDLSQTYTQPCTTFKNPSAPPRTNHELTKDDAIDTPQKPITRSLGTPATTSHSGAASSSQTLPSCLCGHGVCSLHCSFCYRESKTKCAYDSDTCIAQQKSSRCHACDRLGCWTTNPDCQFYRGSRPSVSDARTDGRPAPDIFARSIVRIFPSRFETVVYVDDRKFIKGSASGLTYGLNNCLIHTLQQALDITIGQIVADIPWIRRSLMGLFPTSGANAVTRDNYLDLSEHWKAIIDLISESARLNGCDPLKKFSHTSFQLSV